MSFYYSWYKLNVFLLVLVQMDYLSTIPVTNWLSFYFPWYKFIVFLLFLVHINCLSTIPGTKWKDSPRVGQPVALPHEGARAARQEVHVDFQHPRSGPSRCIWFFEFELQGLRSEKGEKNKISIFTGKSRPDSLFVPYSLDSGLQTFRTTLESSRGQILRQSRINATSKRWHLYGCWLKKPGICPWVVFGAV